MSAISDCRLESIGEVAGDWEQMGYEPAAELAARTNEYFQTDSFSSLFGIKMGSYGTPSKGTKGMTTWVGRP
jgi:hypothetical protein